MVFALHVDEPPLLCHRLPVVNVFFEPGRMRRSQRASWSSPSSRSSAISSRLGYPPRSEQRRRQGPRAPPPNPSSSVCRRLYCHADRDMQRARGLADVVHISGRALDMQAHGIVRQRLVNDVVDGTASNSIASWTGARPCVFSSRWRGQFEAAGPRRVEADGGVMPDGSDTIRQLRSLVIRSSRRTMARTPAAHPESR
jgi:hypothetical protein